MISRKIFLGALGTLIVFLCLSSCNQNKQAINTVKALKSMDIPFFYEWSYDNKGTPEIKVWYKNFNEGILYSFRFMKDKLNREEIYITHPSEFFGEQKASIKFSDGFPSKTYKYKDSIVITKLNWDTGLFDKVETLTKDNISFLGVNNMFNKLQIIGKRLDEIGISRVEPSKGRVRFVMTDGTTLTYLPDNVDENFKKGEIEGSEMIEPNWWLYKNKL